MNLSQIIFAGDLTEVNFNNLVASLPDNLSVATGLRSSILTGEFSLLFFESTIASLDIFGDNILGQSGDSKNTLSDELAVFFIKLEVEYSQQNFATGKLLLYWLNRKAAQLASWFVNKAMYWANINALNLHSQLQQNLQEHLQVLQSYGEEIKIASLTRLNERLQLFSAKWEHNLQSAILVTKLQQQFFVTLSEQLQCPTWEQDPEQVALQCLSRLAQLYTSKFAELKLNLIVQILKKIQDKVLLTLNFPY